MGAFLKMGNIFKAEKKRISRKIANKIFRSIFFQIGPEKYNQLDRQIDHALPSGRLNPVVRGAVHVSLFFWFSFSLSLSNTLMISFSVVAKLFSLLFLSTSCRVSPLMFFVQVTVSFALKQMLGVFLHIAYFIFQTSISMLVFKVSFYMKGLRN